MTESTARKLETKELDDSELDCVGGGFQATEHGAMSGDTSTHAPGYGHGWCYWHPYAC